VNGVCHFLFVMVREIHGGRFIYFVIPGLDPGICRQHFGGGT
jgi:hypothetical protein